jgi:pimeloyl-ACP methyl ester carboxylesterase
MMLAGLAVAPASVSATSTPVAAVQTVAWGPCADPVLVAAHAECGFVSVPLDYGQPSGPTIQLAVSRVAHTVPASEYQGVMLVNPGGPGSPGLELATLGQFVPNHVGDGYDWIGFDPRGVGSSKPALSCIPDYFGGDRPPYVPTKPAILDKWLARSKAFADACEAAAPQLLPHMKTSDSARDMDSIRVALGARQINFYGFSYGTYLGQVYATLFPTHVRRMVLDSNVDPRYVWYKDNIHQAVAVERNIRIWFGWLAKYDAVYHLGKTESAVERLFYREDEGLRRQPADGVIGPDEWEDVFLGAAYSQSLWTVLGATFSAWVNEHDSGALLAAYEFVDTPGDDNWFAAYSAVVCTDAPSPPQWSTWARDYTRTYRIAPFATWNNAWFGAPCLFWPVAAGTPVTVNGNHVPALLIDETLDAATPYGGSLEVRKLFPDASLVAEPGGTTHAGTLFGNACVDGHIADYLATGALPPRRPRGGADATCAPLPQPVPGGAAQTQGARRALQTRSLNGRVAGRSR